MFERYSTSARRVVFFARYEASLSASESIEVEHLLLGLLREDNDFKDTLPEGAVEEIRAHFAKLIPKDAQRISTSVDMPLSADCKLALAIANEESRALEHQKIDSGHLVLALLRLERCAAGDILRQKGIEYGKYRAFLQAGGVRNKGPRVRAFQKREVVFERVTGGEFREPEPSHSAAPTLLPIVLRLEALVDKAAGCLDGQSEIDGELRLKRASWTRQEALGHLVDWGTTHQQWFARALSDPVVLGISYPLPEWVRAQEYLQFGWRDLVDLWVCINRLLIHVLSRVPQEKLETPCRIGVEPPVTLSALIANYIDHCEDVMAQILARGSAPNPSPE